LSAAKDQSVGVFTKETARRVLKLIRKGFVQWLNISRISMKIIKFMLLAVVVWGGLFTVTDPAFAQTWTLTSAPSGGWGSVASSADGTKIVAVAVSIGAGSGAIFTSTNSGTTWRSNGLPQAHWFSVASSADGTKLVAANMSENIYTSTDAGLNWISNSLPMEVWTSVASSADGTNLVAVTYENLIYTSTNSGTTWISNSTVMGNYSWYSVASSADGIKLAIAANSGAIYLSTNSGTTWTAAWTNAASAPGTNWQTIVSSADGTRLALIDQDGLVYTSPDSGATWRSNSLPSARWTSIASSADGSKLVAAACPSYDSSGRSGGPIYISTNSGTTWTLNPSSNYWGFVASSADGSKLLAGLGSGIYHGVKDFTILGGIYALQTTPTPQLNLSPADRNLAISWIVPSTNFVLQQCPDLCTSIWTDVTNTPALNLTNLQNEVILSPTSGSGFYRLKTP
jgi:photosystem II stability/assembly factor-like uncharacterized protein